MCGEVERGQKGIEINGEREELGRGREVDVGVYVRESHEIEINGCS